MMDKLDVKLGRLKRLIEEREDIFFTKSSLKIRNSYTIT
jgi:hypothetical protein